MNRTVGLWTVVGVGAAVWVAADTWDGSATEQIAQTCSEGGYMLVMGGVEDPATIPDPDRAGQYGPAVGSLVESYGAFYVLRKAPDVIYEGDWPDWKLAVISKWPCRETGNAFWTSDAYQNEVKPLRENAGVYDVGMFDAGNPGQPAPVQDYVPEACNDPFLILGLTKVTDAAAYGAYSEAVVGSNLPRRAGYELLFGGTPVDVLEGAWPEGYRAMVSTYPCRQAWEAFYLGQPYQSEIKPLRDGAGDFIIIGFGLERVG